MLYPISTHLEAGVSGGVDRGKRELKRASPTDVVRLKAGEAVGHTSAQSARTRIKHRLETYNLLESAHF